MFCSFSTYSWVFFEVWSLLHLFHQTMAVFCWWIFSWSWEVPVYPVMIVVWSCIVKWIQLEICPCCFLKDCTLNITYETRYIYIPNLVIWDWPLVDVFVTSAEFEEDEMMVREKLALCGVCYHLTSLFAMMRSCVFWRWCVGNPIRFSKPKLSRASLKVMVSWWDSLIRWRLKSPSMTCSPGMLMLCSM